MIYDALGRAVEAGGKELVYGPSGAMMEAMTGQTADTEYVPLPGGAAAVYEGSTLAYYRNVDWQGSARLASTPGRTLYSATQYAAFGQPFDSTAGPDLSFTGQPQLYGGDQYNFPMRNLSPIQGRWWTPDPAGLAAVNPENPQTWNAYAYVNGGPLEETDPLGLFAPVCYNWWGCGPLSDVLDDDPFIWDLNQSRPVPFGGSPTMVGITVPARNISALLPAMPACPKGYAQQKAFLQQDYSGADAAAQSIGVTPADILGLAAFESNWGRNNATRFANNPLSLTSGPSFPGATGTWRSSYGVAFGVYANFAANAMSFALSPFGAQVQGQSSPGDFAAALDAPGGLHYSNPAEISDASYIAMVSGAIDTVARLLPCLF